MQQNKIIVLVTVLIFLCACLAFGGGFGLGFGLSDVYEQTTSDPQVVVTIEEEPATYEPAERPAQRGRLLLEDDFSLQQWQVYRDDDHHKGYADEQYFIVVDTQDYSYWSIAAETYEDFVLEIETTQLDGPDDNDYGLILRYQNDVNFYSFEISSDGYYTFGKLVDDELLSIIPWQESEAINQGHGHNTLRVEAVGPDFTFYINDELVDAAIDSEFGQGKIGLLAGTYQESGTHIAFDNLKVWAVE